MDITIRGMIGKFGKERGLQALPENELFETFSAHCAVSQFYESQFDADRLRMGQGGDLGIDAVAILINGELIDVADVKAKVEEERELRVHFIVVQAKTSPHFEAKVFTDLADSLVHLFTAKSLTYQCSDAVRELRTAIDSVYADIGKLIRELPRLSVWYATTGRRGDDFVEAKRKAAERRLDDSERFSSVSMDALGARELKDLYKQSKDTVTASIVLESRITMPGSPGIRQAVLALMPARDLVDHVLTDRAGGMRALFDENVRHFQDYNTVNQDIRRTLRNPLERHRFAVLNNGITIVARSVTRAGKEFRLHDFQIVNGCQTCHVLFDERESLDNAVFVNVRLIESKDEDVITSIVNATNQQTAVTDINLAARQRIHRELEEFFTSQAEERQLFYERRAGQYDTAAGITKSRIVSFAQLSRAYAAMIMDNAAWFGHYKQVLHEHGDDIFQQSHDSLPYYTSAATLYCIDRLFTTKRIPRLYNSARFHLLAGVRLTLVGASMPRSGRRLTEACDRILDVMWDPAASESLVRSLLPALLKAKGDTQTTFGTVARTKRFGEDYRRLLLEAATSERKQR
jgi:hypothetical protein